MMLFISIAAGLVLLFLGAELMVRGAVALAKRCGISPLIIGITIVGFGTSAPELVVSVEAAMVGRPAIAIGNVIGSNICNMMLILGAAALIYPITINPVAVRRDGLFMALATVAFIAVAASGAIGALAAGLMLLVLLSFMGYSLWRDMRAGDAATAMHLEEVAEFEIKQNSLWISLTLTFAGLAALLFGSDLLVDGATTLAQRAGVSDEVIGLTLIAIGTSLPELATGIVAAYRRHCDVCLGNVLGSNVFNLLGIMGVTGMVTTVPVSAKIIGFDLPVLFIATALMMAFIVTGRRLNRWEGAVLVSGFGAYITSQFLGVSGVALPG